MKERSSQKPHYTDQILKALAAFPEGIGIRNLLESTGLNISRRTLQKKLSLLLEEGKIRSEGKTNQLRYFLVKKDKEIMAQAPANIDLSLSDAAKGILERLKQPSGNRPQAGYNRQFLDAYLPNRTAYLSASEKARLAELGKTTINDAPAGTYARQILGRLLIDLSWNSSRLEGNTYSLLDTQRLLAEGMLQTGKSVMETQMILNHKDAIEFIVDNADNAIGFNRYTITALHALLSNNLLPNSAASGRLRTFPVGITNSAYTPTAIPQLIEECFEIMLNKAAIIENPFEQAFFIMVHLPYLQPFDDVNKRVSRLAVNIPLNRHNLSPLSFADVAQDIYIAGLLGVYEFNDTTLLKEVFLWAYERSAARYSALRQTLGEPDPFRLQYRNQLRSLIKSIINQVLNPTQASAQIQSFAAGIPAADKDKFIEAVDVEILNLHEGNFARYLVTPSQFRIWQEQWNRSLHKNQ